MSVETTVHDIGRQLAERRAALRLSQQEVADLAGCSTRFLRELEHGKPTVRVDKLLAVTDVLGLELGLHRRSRQ